MSVGEEIKCIKQEEFDRIYRVLDKFEKEAKEQNKEHMLAIDVMKESKIRTEIKLDNIKENQDKQVADATAKAIKDETNNTAVLAAIQAMKDAKSIRWENLSWYVKGGVILGVTMYFVMSFISAFKAFSSMIPKG